jgi:hypothetical protein
LLNIAASPALASANSCPGVVRAWKEAADCQVTELIEPLTWADGYTQEPQRGRGKWSDISMNGPCPKYATAFRNVKAFPISGTTQVVEVKAITRRVDIDGRYTGDYSVSKARYTCEKRRGQWRIYSQVVTQRADFQNKAAPRRHERVR